MTTPAVAGHPRLTRAAAGLRPAAPVRAVHLGLGSFFRAHQAWYTDRAVDAADWGIAAYAGRSAHLARALSEQGGAYTLLSRGSAGTVSRQVASLSSAHPADDHRSWLAHLAAAEVAVVTLTVTESAYRRAPDGGLDLGSDDVARDVLALRDSPGAPARTVPGRLLGGLIARRDGGSGPIAIVPCDNLSGNGAAVQAVVTQLADEVDPSMLGWLAEHVSFAETMVDRITPATTPADADEVAATTGFSDEAVVVTEEFSEWFLAGDFPGGRPRWESAGARFVPSVAPYEQRKLWLLNGAHSLLAYAGSVRGHDTVAEAIADPVLRGWVVAWWDEAAAHLDLPSKDTAAYREALLQRFANPRLRHLLAQIAADGSTKLPERLAVVVRLERAAGRVPTGAARILAAWALHLLGRGAPVRDDGLPGASALRAPTGLDEAVAGVVGHVVPELSGDLELRRAVLQLAITMER